MVHFVMLSITRKHKDLILLTRRFASHSIRWRSPTLAKVSQSDREDRVISGNYFSPSLYYFPTLTISENQRYAIYQSNGQIELADGPMKKKSLFLRKIQKLYRVTASPNEFLVINKPDGTVVHESGPTSTFAHPNEEIRIAKKLQLRSGEAVVVYSTEKKNVFREVIHGPTKLVLQPNQWTHLFSWPDEEQEEEFTHLQTVNTLDVSLTGLKTKDNITLSTVKVSVSFKIENIEKMMDESSNPLTDISSAISADLLDFIGGMQMNDFKSELNELNSLSKLPMAKARAMKIGVTLVDCDFGGFSVDKAIQTLMDKEIESLINAKINHEDQMEKQRLFDMDIKHETDKLNFEIKCQQMKAASELKTSMEEKRRNAIHLNATSIQEHKRKLEHYENLKNLGVDLTQVIVAENTMVCKCQNKKE